MSNAYTVAMIDADHPKAVTDHINILADSPREAMDKADVLAQEFADQCNLDPEREEDTAPDVARDVNWLCEIHG